MLNKNKENPNRIARIAGVMYFLQIPFGIFGILYVPNTLIVKNNPLATVSNILQNEILFRFSMVSAIICALITLVTAIFMYKLFINVNKNMAKLLIVFTMISASIAMINELNHVAVLLLVKNSEITLHLQLQQLINLFLELHEYGIRILDIFFGLWLFPMGYLVLKSNFIPKIIGLFLIIACFGYILNFFTFFIIPDFKFLFSEYTFIGEVMMVFWLLVKGVDIRQWEKETAKYTEI